MAAIFVVLSARAFLWEDDRVRRGEGREGEGEGRRGEERRGKGRVGVGNVVMLLSVCGGLLRPVQTKRSYFHIPHKV